MFLSGDEMSFQTYFLAGFVTASLAVCAALLEGDENKRSSQPLVILTLIVFWPICGSVLIGALLAKAIQKFILKN